MLSCLLIWHEAQIQQRDGRPSSFPMLAARQLHRHIEVLIWIQGEIPALFCCRIGIPRTWSKWLWAPTELLRVHNEYSHCLDILKLSPDGWCYWNLEKIPGDYHHCTSPSPACIMEALKHELCPTVLHSVMLTVMVYGLLRSKTPLVSSSEGASGERSVQCSCSTRKRTHSDLS